MNTVDGIFREGVAALQAGGLDSAEEAFLDVLRQSPEHAGALSNLGVIARRRGDTKVALNWYRRAAEAPDAPAGVLLNLGLALEDLGAADEAIGHLSKGLEAVPDHARARLRLARLLGRRGDVAAADGHLEELHKRKDANVSALELGANLAWSANRPDIAEKWLCRLLDAEGAGHELVTRLAVVWWETDRRDAALDLFRRICAARPDDGAAFGNLSFALSKMFRRREAVAVSRRWMELAPDDPLAFADHGGQLFVIGNVAGAMKVFNDAADRFPDDPVIRSVMLFSALYRDDVNADDVSDLHRRHVADCAAWRHAGLAAPPNITGERQLRIGYLSPDLTGNYPVAQFIMPLLERHGRDECGLTTIVYDAAKPSVGGGNVESPDPQNVEWVPLAGLDDTHAAERIRSDGIDLLIDLSGHSRGNRLGVFARRPAPIQATFIGYPSTTGADFIDYIIADNELVPPAFERLYSERVARLPNSFLCYKPGPDHPTPRPRDAGSAPVLGSLNNLPKLNGRTLALWARVLKAVPDARLLIKSAPFIEAGTRDDFAGRCAAAGIDRDRLILEKPEPLEDALAAYDRIDVALDPLPYNGGTTTCQALAMGVPVVTLPGRGFAGRMGASILRAAGRGEWIAADDDAYVEIAANLVRDRAGLSAHCRDLSQGLAETPLGDLDAYAADVGALWRKLARGES